MCQSVNSAMDVFEGINGKAVEKNQIIEWIFDSVETKTTIEILCLLKCPKNQILFNAAKRLEKIFLEVNPKVEALATIDPFYGDSDLFYNLSKPLFEQLDKIAQILEQHKEGWSRDRNTMYRIPIGTEVIMFRSDNVTGDILDSCRAVQDGAEKVFNGKFLLKVSRCECGCKDEIMLFQYARDDKKTLIYQVNAQEVLVSSRKEYEATTKWGYGAG